MIFQLRRKDGIRPFIAWGDSHELNPRSRANTITWNWYWREFMFGVRGFWCIPFDWSRPSLSLEVQFAFFNVRYSYNSFRNWDWRGNTGILAHVQAAILMLVLATMIVGIWLTIWYELHIHPHK